MLHNAIHSGNSTKLALVNLYWLEYHRSRLASIDNITACYVYLVPMINYRGRQQQVETRELLPSYYSTEGIGSAISQPLNGLKCIMQFYRQISQGMEEAHTKLVYK